MRRLIGYILFIAIGSFIIALAFYQKLGVFEKSAPAIPALNYCLDSSDYNDVIYIGNSRVIYHINPAIIDSMDGIKSYSVAIDGAELIEQNLLLNEYLLHHPKPKIVFLSIDYNIFNIQGIPNCVTNYFPYLDVPSVYRILSQYKLVYRYKFFQYYFSILKIFALPDKERKNRILTALFNYPPFIEPPDEVYSRGFFPLTTRWGARAENELKTVKSKIRYDQEGFDLLKSMVDVCRHDSVEVVFIVPPAYCEIGTKFLNADEVIDKAKEVAVKNNVPFWDYRTLSICKSKDYFYDFLHLNYIGAAIYSKQLAVDIKAKLYPKSSLSAVSVSPK